MNRQTVKKLKKDESESTNSKERQTMDINDSLDSSGIESNEDVDEVTKRTNEAMKQVFRIPSVVQQIIEGLQDLSDLKSCRSVSSMWLETTTKVMTKGISVFVLLNDGVIKYGNGFQWRINHYYDDFKFEWLSIKDVNVGDSHDLTDLKEIVVKSTQFPCSTFVIFQEDLNDLHVEDFLKVVGKSIKHLTLVGVDEKCVELAVLSGLNCPNLETLYMDGGYIEWSPEDISFELPKLKVLHMRSIFLYKREDDEDEEDSEELSIFKILTTLIAPNLQVIKEFFLWKDWEAVTEAGKINCIKELTCIVGDPDDLTKLEMFVQVGPQLEVLELYLSESFLFLDLDGKSKWMRLIQKLLNLNKTTLKSFDFEEIENVFGSLNFPQFPQLREIKISSWTVEAGVRYPYEILSNDISPNLQVIRGFHLDRDVQEVLRTGKIHCVKELNLYLEGLKLEPLRLFLSGRSQLEILQLHGLVSWETNLLDWPRGLTDLLEQLLELNKDTLRRFEFNGVGAVCKDIKFPKFSKLKYLKFTGDCVRIFPRGINLTKTFPKLKILDLHGYNHEFYRDENWNSYFPPPDAFTGSLTSVKTLIVRKRFTVAAVRNLLTICPNAKVIQFN